MDKNLQYIDDLAAGSLTDFPVKPKTDWTQFQSTRLLPAQRKIKRLNIGKFIAISGLIALISSLFFFKNNTETVKAEQLIIKSGHTHIAKKVVIPEIKLVKTVVTRKPVVVHKKVFVTKTVVSDRKKEAK